MRNQLGKDLNIVLEPLPENIPSFLNAEGKKIESSEDLAHATPQPTASSHDILLAEADAILAVAEEFSHENIRFEAMLNYHTAAVFYRVLMSMVMIHMIIIDSGGMIGLFL